MPGEIYGVGSGSPSTIPLSSSSPALNVNAANWNGGQSSATQTQSTSMPGQQASDPLGLLGQLLQILQSVLSLLGLGSGNANAMPSQGGPSSGQPSGANQPSVQPLDNPGSGPSTGSPVQARTTFYAPGAGGNIEGGWETSRPNMNGQSLPVTLDDVRLAQERAARGENVQIPEVTLASDPSNYGEHYDLGRVTYTSPKDGKTYTLDNVKGYVHDTGSAFQGRPDKFDVAVGDFRGWSASRASAFVDRQDYGANVLHTWYEVGNN